MAENNVSKNTPAQIPEREVRQWRVGTVSMGLILVALGIALLMGRANHSLTFATLLKFWPSILIILGFEMVLLNTLTLFKRPKIRFTYDILSIFLVLLLLFVSSGLAALESAGVLEIAQRTLLISERTVEAEKVLHTVDDTLETLCLEIDGMTNLSTYDGNQVKVVAVYKGYFASQEEAGRYAEEQYTFVQPAGSTLFVQVFSPARNVWPDGNVWQEVSVLVPKELNVEITQRSGGLKLNLQDLQGNFVVNRQFSYQPMEVVLDNPQNDKVLVELTDSGEVQGNVPWDSVVDEAPELYRAEKVWGDGSHSLVLRQVGGTIKINTK